MTPWGYLAVRVPEEDKAWWNDRVEILKALGVLDDQGQGTERLEVVKTAKVARLSKEEFDALRQEYQAACIRCHAPDFVGEQMAANDEIIRQADKVMAEAIRVVQGLYDDGLLTKPAGWSYAPDLLQFYETQSTIEQELYRMFMEYRMRTFQGAFHNNPDYQHWYGWAAMKEALQRIKDEATAMRADAANRQAQEQVAELQSQVEKGTQEAAATQGAELKTLQEVQQATQQQLVEVKTQVQVAANNLNKVTGETESLKNQIATATNPSVLPWIAGALAIIALAIGIVALVRRRV
jgi:mono/diheme cytochrome c family protein